MLRIDLERLLPDLLRLFNLAQIIQRERPIIERICLGGKSGEPTDSLSVKRRSLRSFRCGRASLSCISLMRNQLVQVKGVSLMLLAQGSKMSEQWHRDYVQL